MVPKQECVETNELEHFRDASSEKRMRQSNAAIISTLKSRPYAADL